MMPATRHQLLVLVSLAFLTSTGAVTDDERRAVAAAAGNGNSQQCPALDWKALASRSAEVFRDAFGDGSVACVSLRQDRTAARTVRALFARNPVDALVARLVSEWEQKQDGPLEAFADSFLRAQLDNPMARFLLAADGGPTSSTTTADGHLQGADYLQARATLTHFQHIVFQDTLQDSIEILRFALNPTAGPRSHAPSPPAAKQPEGGAPLRGMSRLANFADLDLKQMVWRSHRTAILKLLSHDMVLYQDMRLLALERATGAITRCRAAATRCPVAQSLIQLSIRLRP